MPSAARKQYMADWRSRNKHRKAGYNATLRKSVAANRAAFESGQRERAEQKRCSLCKTVKVAAEFYKANSDKSGLSGWCKECSDQRAVESIRKRQHGITREDYADMYRRQDGRCAICRTDEPTAGKKSFCVDHDHGTGKVRGLLCTRCNTMLGNALDSVETLKAAIDYLEAAK